MENVIKATELLKELGYPPSIWKSGPAVILRTLQSLGIQPCGTNVLGQGISFDVANSDAEKAREFKRKENGGAAGVLTGKSRRDIRTVARAVLDLYERLGEEPHGLNEIRKIAER